MMPAKRHIKADAVVEAADRIAGQHGGHVTMPRLAAEIGVATSTASAWRQRLLVAGRWPWCGDERPGHGYMPSLSPHERARRRLEWARRHYAAKKLARVQLRAEAPPEPEPEPEPNLAAEARAKLEAEISERTALIHAEWDAAGRTRRRTPWPPVGPLAKRYTRRPRPRGIESMAAIRNDWRAATRRWLARVEERRAAS